MIGIPSGLERLSEYAAQKKKRRPKAAIPVSDNY